ncbi:hypothetical protein MXB_3171 [Myxobolus squamalis]|nr:hypothetical protein MXB_3171 [Myxobolus squamalis]
MPVPTRVGTLIYLASG